MDVMKQQSGKTCCGGDNIGLIESIGVFSFFVNSFGEYFLYSNHFLEYQRWIGILLQKEKEMRISLPTLKPNTSNLIDGSR